MEDDISEKEAQEILRNFSESKTNMHTFFNNVVKSVDTTKTGYLTEDELGMSNLPVRTYKELALFSKDVADQAYWGDYFEKMSEIQTSSSLSKHGFLMKLSVTQKKEMADVSPKKENKGWFRRNDDKGENT